MKKLFTIIMTLVMLLCCVSVSAVAEIDRQTASTVLDHYGEGIIVTVDLTGGWSVEFAPGALYLYEGEIAEGREADAIGLTLEKEVYDEYYAEAENSKNYREIENGVCYTSEDTTYYVIAVGSSAYFLLDVPNGVDGDAIYARLDLVNEKESHDAESSEVPSGKKVYFAAPLFSQSEKDYNLQLAHILEAHGYEVFLPQRDGYLATELEGKTEEEMAQMIFQKDVSEVLKADIIFMVLDGRVPDEGACVELGIAYASGKRCYGVKTDARSVEINMDLNPMICGCFTKLFTNYDGEALIEELEQYLAENEL